MREYPKRLFAKQDGEIVSRIVNSPAEQDELGEGYFESPGEADAGEVAAPASEAKAKGKGKSKSPDA